MGLSVVRGKLMVCQILPYVVKAQKDGAEHLAVVVLPWWWIQYSSWFAWSFLFHY